MVSQRQREARKRFKAANPDLFPRPEQPRDPSAPSNKRKKKERYFNKLKEKRRKRDAAARTKEGSATFRKRPLRVPGMKPGETCFICKSKDHIAKLCPKKSEWERNKICLLCRERGHSLKNCPEKNEGNDKKFCYNCGEAGHSLSKCPAPLQDGGTQFASCFVCNERGHLSKNCPKNTHGIYPKGGSCKTCGEVTHLAKDCPNKGCRSAVSISGVVNTCKHGESWQGRLTVFQSGDDFEDDFTIENEKNNIKCKPSYPALDQGPFSETEKPVSVKPKKMSGPNVVNFAG